MITLILEPNLSEATFSKNIVLDGVVTLSETPSVAGDVYWRWEEEPTMKPEFLGRVTAGHSLRIPFETKGRDLHLYLVSETSNGLRSVSRIEEAVQTVFTPSTVPVLADLTFDGGTDEVAGTIAENNGTGTIRILRQLGANEFVEIDSAPTGTTGFIDMPTLDGTYNYKLAQDGQSGEGNVRTAVVSGVSGPAGSPPTALSGTFDGIDTVTLNWTNNGGTGANIIEQKIGSGGIYVAADSVASGVATTDILVTRGSSHQTYYYRVRNESVAGYSNEDGVFVPREV